jgi:hypothetical protein
MDMQRKLGGMLILLAFIWLFWLLYDHSLGAIGCLLASVFLAIAAYKQWKKGIRDKK